MTRRVLLVVMLVTLLAAALIYLRNRITLADMNSMIAKEIPSGTEVQMVFSFLDSLRAEHSGLVKTKRDADFDGEPDLVFAAIRDLRRGNPLAEGIFMKFRFDSAGRLTDHRVRYVYTGP